MATKKKILWAGIAVSLLLAIAAVSLSLLGANGPTIDPDDPTQVAEGRQLYAVHCALCHGSELQGQPDWRQRLPNGRLPAPPHDSSGHTWHHSDAQLIVFTKKGISGIMPGYESDMPGFEMILTDAQIAAVLAFIKASWPPDIRARQERLNAPN